MIASGRGKIPHDAPDSGDESARKTGLGSMEILRLRIEKQGRAGKTVTVIEGLTREKRLMEEMTAGLRRTLSTGGTFRERTIFLQGDQRVRLKPLLQEKGFTVKG
jgi:translation initiation factor 1